MHVFIALFFVFCWNPFDIYSLNFCDLDTSVWYCVVVCGCMFRVLLGVCECTCLVLCVCTCVSVIDWFYFSAHFSKIHFLQTCGSTIFFSKSAMNAMKIQLDNCTIPLALPPATGTLDMVWSAKNDCSREDQSRQREEHGAEQQQRTQQHEAQRKTRGRGECATRARDCHWSRDGRGGNRCLDLHWQFRVRCSLRGGNASIGFHVHFGRALVAVIARRAIATVHSTANQTATTQATNDGICGSNCCSGCGRGN